MARLQFKATGKLLPKPTDPVDPPPCEIDCNEPEPPCEKNCEPQPEPEPVDPINPEVPIIPEPAKDPVFNLAYFVPTGSGPYLINRFFNVKETRTSFRLNLNESLDWTYAYGDVLGDDKIT